MKKITPAAALFFLLSVFSAEAQFHQKSSATGTTGVKQMNNPYGARPTQGALGTEGIQAASPNSSGQKRINAVVINPEAVARANESVRQLGGAGMESRLPSKIQESWMDIKDADVWGRSENHTDGTYTEEVFDTDPEKPKQKEKVLLQTPYGQLPATQITQITRKRRGDSLDSKEDPVVMIRKITVDTYGNPTEVWIFDGKGQYRFHGQFIYDVRGRLTEEQIRDVSGKLIRRVIQEYDGTGNPLPLKNVDYVKDVPKELILVESDPVDDIMQSKLDKLIQEKEGATGFAKWKQKMAAREKLKHSSPGKAGAPATAVSSSETKGFQLLRKRTSN